ncbi:MAG: NUDIX domain-containing protein [archaeon]|jgi:8-oxo-dGTP pyrophosphatase MutT (NUDIX family)
MEKLEQSGKEETVFQGQIFEVIKKLMKKGNKVVEFEIARRAPGTRLIIIKNDKVLLSKEFRYELNDYDYRLPGGKVFDTLKEYKQAMTQSQDVLLRAKKAAEKECLEETGIVPKNINFFYLSHSGGPTVEWDLYYFIVDSFEENAGGQKLGLGEDIKTEWKTQKEIEELCVENKINEDRTVGVLFKFFRSKQNKN